MAKQLAPLLKPPPPPRPSSGGAGRGGSSAEPATRDALNMPILPVAGFFRRLGAMVFDFLLLWLVQRVIAAMMPDIFLDNPNPAWFLAGVVTFLYFALGDGPVGKGATVGKLLVGLRVTNLDGGVPSLAQALIRTAILFPGLLISRGVNSWAFAGDTFAEAQFALLFTLYLMVALFVANAFAIIFNPFKMGLHDYVSKTLVRPASLVTSGGEPFSNLTDRIGEGWRRHFLQPQLMGIGTFVIVFGYLLFSQWPTALEEERRAKFAFERQLLREAGFPEAATLQAGGFVPIPAAETLTREDYESLRRLLEGEDTPGELLYRLRITHSGRWPHSAPETEELSERYARWYHQRIFGGFEGADLGTNWQNVSTNALRQSTFTFRVEVLEYFDLLFPAWENPIATREFTFDPLEVVEAPELPTDEASLTEDLAPESTLNESSGSTSTY